MDEKFREYLSKLTCRGCYNHCPLNNPNCGRSKIFIKEAQEKFEKETKKSEEQNKNMGGN